MREGAAEDDHTELRLLLGAVAGMSADLNLDRVLRRIVQVGSRLVGSRYAALGVLDAGPEGRLRTFVQHGMSPEEEQAVGERPRGRGLSDCSSSILFRCGYAT